MPIGSEQLERLRPLVLLDRDGTINQEVDYLSHPEQLRLLPGAVRGLQRLREGGMTLAIVSNQSGVGRGFFTEETLSMIHQRLRALLAEEGVVIDGIYYCTHRPEEGCCCRKPKQGLALKAAAELRGDLRQSFIVGDKACDIQLGKAVGAQTILVRTGYGTSYDFTSDPIPDVTVENLEEASLWILSRIN